MPKKIQILQDDAIKGVKYSANQVAEFPNDLANAIVYQKRGRRVPDETAITPVPEAPATAAPEKPARKAKP